MSTRPSPSSARPVTPLQAARKRVGLTQTQVAEMIGAPVSSYIPWDQGRRKPQDPLIIQAISEALRTSPEVLWPPEGNPVIGPKLRALREQQANEQTLAHDGRVQEASQHDLQAADPAVVVPAPAPEAGGGLSSLHREISATLDSNKTAPPALRQPLGPQRRFLLSAAAGVAVAAIAGTAIATSSGGESQRARQAAVVQDAPTAAERQRTTQQAALVEAKSRGDYDAAITAASRLNDTAAVAELRGAAGDLLARRARQAADRGDLPLASSRLNRAEERYGDSSAIGAVRRRIDQIKDARKQRIAERKRTAQRRAAARARAAAAARQRTQSQAPPPSSRSTPSAPAPATPSPSPTPSPVPSPKPAPSTGGGSSGGSGASSSKPVDPGIF